MLLQFLLREAARRTVHPTVVGVALTLARRPAAPPVPAAVVRAGRAHLTGGPLEPRPARAEAEHTDAVPIAVHRAPRGDRTVRPLEPRVAHADRPAAVPVVLVAARWARERRRAVVPGPSGAAVAPPSEAPAVARAPLRVDRGERASAEVDLARAGAGHGRRAVLPCEANVAEALAVVAKAVARAVGRARVAPLADLPVPPGGAEARAVDAQAPAAADVPLVVARAVGNAAAVRFEAARRTKAFAVSERG